MFNNFIEFFKAKPLIKNYTSTISILEKLPEVKYFLESYNGQSFGGGIYRVHDMDKIVKWTRIAEEFHPGLKDKIICFAYDWLGRQFALDFRRIVSNKPQILLLEPGTGQALEIPCDFESFHEQEIVRNHIACLASDFYSSWVNVNDEELQTYHCIGYKVPLFLGGSDTIENLEKSDMEVYWSICTQLLLK